MPKGIPLTEAEQNRRRHEIFSASVNLFLKQGFRETSMQQIADAAGIGKSTLYDYFKNKEDILLWVIADDIADLTAIAQEIASQDLPAAQRLRQVMRAHLEYLQSTKELTLKLYYEIYRLSARSQQHIQQMRHAYQDLLSKLVQEAIDEGAFRPVSPLLAVRTILSILSPVVFTTRPTGTPEQMMEEAIDIFFKGVER